MIVYGDRTFCMRKGCGVKKCPRHICNVDWSFGLPVSVADFWGKSRECPSNEPKRMKMKTEEEIPCHTKS